MKTFLATCIRLLPLAIFLSVPAAAEWKDVGSLKIAAAQGAQIVFSNAKTSVSVTALAPDLIRVRITRGTTPGPDHSWAVVKTDWSVLPVESTAGPNLRTIRTPERLRCARNSPPSA